MGRKIVVAFSIFTVIYLAIGLAFHVKWTNDLDACREIRKAQGEFVEPEVFAGLLGLVFDMTNWPVYAGANIYHFGTPFSTPCRHSKSTADWNDEERIRYVIESFGKRLQNVSLQSPNATQILQEQYAEWVSSDLLGIWMNDPSKAPGRIVSSPWPDRIEINTLTKEDPDRYVATGFVVEVTSMEVVSGGTAAKIPVRIVVQKDQGRWLITEYAEDR